MLYRNAEQDRAFDFISHATFDIFCLQEVPIEFLQRLETLPYHVAHRSERLLLGEKIHNYVVILSKHPIIATGEVPLPEYKHLLPWRTRLFVTLMPDRMFTWVTNRKNVYADIETPQGSMRVFNLHLILARPAWRLHEFELSMAERDPSRPTIVCGDFNVLESPHITPLNWLLGGPLRDAFRYRRERTVMETHFVEHELVNAIRGRVTHPFSRSQLDHILVSSSLSVTDASVLAERYGSDHAPVRAEIA